MRPARCINVHQNAGPGATIPDPGSLTLTRTRRPVKRLKIRRAVLPPPNILKKPFPPEGGRKGAKLRLHKLSQDYPILHSRSQLLPEQPPFSTAEHSFFITPALRREPNLTHCRMYFCLYKSLLVQDKIGFVSVKCSNGVELMQ